MQEIDEVKVEMAKKEGVKFCFLALASGIFQQCISALCMAWDERKGECVFIAAAKSVYTPSLLEFDWESLDEGDGDWVE
ncbi:MAG: hypothetical protein QXG08_08040 [Candidatus Methanomethyliaceae archaeon]